MKITIYEDNMKDVKKVLEAEDAKIPAQQNCRAGIFMHFCMFSYIFTEYNSAGNVSSAITWSGVFAKLPQTLRTDILPVEHRHVLGAITEDAAGPILLEDDRRSLNIDLQCVLFRDVQRPAQLDGQHDTAQLVHASDDPRRFHCGIPPMHLLQTCVR